ncbi:MAG: PAS domain S-box protein [Nitrospirae bacterium]|nr:PAS domain S-box protein [Nitrospirota bacterium]MBF0539973.1 PAS domain S-box protein [Nitrospirota bacterium]
MSTNLINSNFKILIVEDSEVQTIILKKILELEGYSVISASDGLAGIEAAFKHKPDLIISDITMPSMDGYEMCLKIKSNSMLKDIPIILLTQLSDTKDIVKGINSRADSYISKPYNKKHLINRVSSLISDNTKQTIHIGANGVELTIDDVQHNITNDLKQIFGFLVTTFENAMHQNRELTKAQEELRSLNEELEEKVIQRTKELKDSQEQLSTLIQTIPDIVYRVDTNGRFIYVNKAIERLGYKPDELIGKHFSIIIHPEDLNEISRDSVLVDYIGKNTGEDNAPKLFDERRKSRPTTGLQARLIPKSPTDVSSVENYKYFEINSSGVHEFNTQTNGHTIAGTLGVIKEKSVTFNGSSGVIRDISDRWKSEEKLKFITQSIEEAMDGVQIIDLVGIISYSNKAVMKVYGIAPDELLGKDIDDYLFEHNFYKDKVVPKLLIEGRWVGELLIRDKDGNSFPVLLSSSIVKDKDKKPVASVGIIRDLSQTKAMIGALTESENRFRKIFEDGPIGMAFTDCHNDKYVKANKTFCDMLGFSENELLNMSYLNITHPDDLPKDYLHVIKLKHKEISSYKTEKRYIKKNKEIMWGSLTLSVIYDSFGNPEYFLSMIKDITKRKAAADLVVESEKRFREIFDNSGDGIFVTDKQSLTHYMANLEICKMLGYSKEELIGKHVFDLHPKENIEVIKKGFSNHAEGKSKHAVDVPMLRKDGAIIYVDISSSSVTINGNDYLLSIFRDITDRKKAENKLKESEQRFRDIFDHTTDGIILIDPETKTFIMANLQMCNMLGYSNEEFNGMNVMNIHPKEDISNIIIEFERHAKGEIDLAEKIPVQRKDGTIFYADIKSSFVTIAGKNYLMGIFRDITERKEAEEHQQRHLQIQAIINTILELSLKPMSMYDLLDGILGILLSIPWLTLDSKGCILLVENDYNKLKLVAQRNLLPDLLENCDLVPFGYCLCGKSAASKKVIFEDCINELHEHQYLNITEHGHYIIPILSGKNILGVLNLYVKAGHKWEKWEENFLISAANTIAGIIDRKHIEEQLRHYANELYKSNEEMKTFTYIISHDLRAPLVNLKGFSYELKESINEILPLLSQCRKYLDEEQYQKYKQRFEEDIPESLNFIESSSTKIDHMMNAILKLSRLGRNELAMEEINVNEIVKFTISSLSHQIDAKGVEVVCSDLPSVTADRVALEQIFGNLMDNALKYLDPNRKGTIKITGETKGDDIVFHIKDNGIGIATDDFDKVFAIFRRIGRSDEPGEGMGLAYTKALIARHNGTIWCKSELGEGTTFSFTLPA